MSDLTILPINESSYLKNKEMAYRLAVPDRSVAVDLNPLTCEEKLLPYLAQCWQVLYWDELWTVEQKRKFVADAREVHRHIGTPYALTKMFEALDIDAALIEWYEYQGEPYHFKLDLSLEAKAITPDILERLIRYVKVYKNVRTVLDEIFINEKSELFLNFHMALLSEVYDTAITVKES